MFTFRRMTAANDLFNDLFAGAASGVTEIQWMVPRVERLKRWCAANRFHGENEDDFLVYEQPLEALEHFTAREDPPTPPASSE